MASSSDINPISYIIKQQYNDSSRIRETLFKERLRNAKNLYRKDLLAHYGCVNAIEFSEEGNLLVSGGDDRRVLLWFVPDAIYDKGAPVVMQTNHTSNIFCLAFDRFNTKIFSGGNDDQVIVHDIKTGQLILKLPHRNPVYGLSVNPQDDNVLATAGDDGRVLIYDIREHEPEPNILAKESSGFHSVVFHPLNPRLLVTSNADEGIALWDCRKTKKELLIYDRNAGKVSGISACFNSSGSHILALRRRLPPVLYETHNPNALCQFYHPQYYNSCTMKTCCFAGGDDEYVLSGSDDFSLYMWQVPDTRSNVMVEWGEPHVVLQGHRSIVNQVRYNKHNNFIASSGVEKMVKLWSAVPVGTWSGSLLKEHQDPQRNVYSKDDYVYIVGHNAQRISHDYSDQSTQEDLRMMAFFDSLIQTEIQAWNSLSEDTYSSDSDSDKQSQEMIRNSWQSLLTCKRSAEELLKKHKPNKIALLIAQKKNKLAKMAHRKSSSLVLRYNSSDRKNRKKLNKFKNCPGSSCKFKKNNGLSLKNKRTSCRNLSTKYLPLPPPPVPKSTKSNKKITEQQPQVIERKYRTRSQTSRENSNASSSSLDVPSTSTGITETTHRSSVIFRVIDQDSDEESTLNGCTETNDPVENNLVDIIPTPLNGSRGRIYINMVQVTNGGNGGPSNGNVATIRNEECASTSSLQQDDGEGHHFNNSSSVENNGINKDNYESDSSMSDNSERNHKCTPPVKRKRKYQNEVVSNANPMGSSVRTKRTLRSTTTASSSNINYNENSSEDECHQQEKFKKRIKKARVNFRKQIGGDSDSN